MTAVMKFEVISHVKDFHSILNIRRIKCKNINLQKSVKNWKVEKPLQKINQKVLRSVNVCRFE